MRELLERITCAVHVLRGRPLMYRMHLERGTAVLNLGGETLHMRIVRVHFDGSERPTKASAGAEIHVTQ